jgi:hypothetical protein
MTSAQSFDAVVDLTFQQTGSGAVGRSAHDKMREIVSVKDFGAVGDGVANDTAAIQAAIDAVIPTRRELFFPAGDYLVTGLTIALTATPDNGSFTIRGSGMLGSRIYKTGSSTDPIISVSH